MGSELTQTNLILGTHFHSIGSRRYGSILTQTNQTLSLLLLYRRSERLSLQADLRMIIIVSKIDV